MSEPIPNDTTCQPGRRQALLARENIAVPLGVAHHRSLLDRVGLFDEIIYVEHDWDLWKRFVRAGAVFHFSDKKSGLYHVRADSQARQTRIPDAARKAAPRPGAGPN